MSRQSSSVSYSIKFWFSCVFLLIVVLAVVFHKAPTIILGLYVFMSFITYWLYAKDKKAAQNNDWRIPEKTLHILELLCGWPGALVAQSRLRHKSKKTSFIMVLWIMIVLNCMAFMWIFTPAGAEFISEIVGAFVGLFS